MAPVMGGVALAVYVLTLSHGAFPGESARYLVETAGLLPIWRPRHPLWAFLAWVLSEVPIGTMAGKLNGFSALCGAGAVGLLYAVVTRTVKALAPADQDDRNRVTVAAVAAGVAAALCLSFSIPFWVVANRAHPASFHVLLLLTASWLLLRYAETGSLRTLWAFGWVYGIGVVEFATFIVLAPVAGILVLVLLWRRQQLTTAQVAGLLACAGVGLLLYVPEALAFRGSTGHVLAGRPGFFEIVWGIWRDQYGLIKFSLPKVGWLIVLCVTAVPWLTCLLTARRGLNGERDWGFYLLHLVMTVLSIMVIVNLRFAPWSLLGMSRLLVTPYLLNAMVFGYLTAYWFLIPCLWWEGAEKGFRLWLQTWLGAVLALLLLALPVVAAFRNLEAADARPAGMVNAFADEILEAMGDRTWLLTDGSMDAHVLLAANRAGRSIRTISLPGMNVAGYRDYAATLFDRPRLQNAATLGLNPLLDAWLQSDAKAAGEIAMMVMPDLWSAAGLIAVPRRMLFVGADDRSDLDARALLNNHEDFWTRADGLLNAEQARSLTPLIWNYRRHLALVANNLGVLLEDLSDSDEAFRAYAAARRLDPGNISAVLNQAIMVKGGYQTPEAAAILAELDRVAAELGNERFSLWTLPAVNGYVRSPELLASVGWAWALSGSPGLGVSGLQRAMDLVPEEKAGAIKQALAQVYLMQNEPAQSEALYRDLLRRDPNDRRALIELARNALRTRDLEEARTLLDRADKAGVSPALVAVERASLYTLSGEKDRARQLLETTLRESPNALRGWVMLAGLCVEAGDAAALQDCLRRISDIERGHGYFSAVIRGHRALSEKKWDEAVAYFERALSAQPRQAELLEQILRLDLLLGRQDAARGHARRLLQIHAGNALGNYVMGTIQAADGNVTLAEDSFRESLKSAETSEALNDLAWLLVQQLRYGEAERLVRRALELRPEMSEAWDTLGQILLQTARPKEARDAFARSFELFKDNPAVMLHLAQASLRLGERDQARQLMNALDGYSTTLPPALRDEFADLKRELR